jgi:hypothetical protein
MVKLTEASFSPELQNLVQIILSPSDHTKWENTKSVSAHTEGEQVDFLKIFDLSQPKENNDRVEAVNYISKLSTGRQEKLAGFINAWQPFSPHPDKKNELTAHKKAFAASVMHQCIRLQGDSFVEIKNEKNNTEADIALTVATMSELNLDDEGMTNLNKRPTAQLNVLEQKRQEVLGLEPIQKIASALKKINGCESVVTEALCLRLPSENPETTPTLAQHLAFTAPELLDSIVNTLSVEEKKQTIQALSALVILEEGGRPFAKTSPLSYALETYPENGIAACRNMLSLTSLTKKEKSVLATIADNYGYEDKTGPFENACNMKNIELMKLLIPYCDDYDVDAPCRGDKTTNFYHAVADYKDALQNNLDDVALRAADARINMLSELGCRFDAACETKQKSEAKTPLDMAVRIGDKYSDWNVFKTIVSNGITRGSDPAVVSKALKGATDKPPEVKELRTTCETATEFQKIAKNRRPDEASCLTAGFASFYIKNPNQSTFCFNLFKKNPSLVDELAATVPNADENLSLRNQGCSDAFSQTVATAANEIAKIVEKKQKSAGEFEKKLLVTEASSSQQK